MTFFLINKIIPNRIWIQLNPDCVWKRESDRFQIELENHFFLKYKIELEFWINWTQTIYSLCHIKSEIFFLDCPIKNETFLKMKIIISLLFLLFYFTFFALTHKNNIILIMYRFQNVLYVMRQSVWERAFGFN